LETEICDSLENGANREFKVRAMNQAEYRIGNYLQDVDGEEFKIGGETIDDPRQFDCFAPIPLNETWLKRFGFVRPDAFYSLPMDQDLSYKFGEMNDVWTVFIKQTGRWPFWHCGRTEYVHEVQNLYFFLTHKELEVKV